MFMALRHLRVALPGIIGIILVIGGCGSDRMSLEEAQAKIDELSDAGMPDSALSSAKVHLYQAKSAKTTGNSGIARRSTDSLIIALDRAEQQYAEWMESFAPVVDSLTAVLGEKKVNLTGLQLKAADSAVAVIDSFVGRNWMIQARAQALKADTLLTQLVQDEEKAQEIRKKLPGKWVGIRDAKTEGGKKAVEKRIVVFGGDGSLHLTESMKGFTSDNFKEDWEFISSGTWDVKGDTAVLKISEEKCTRQNFWTLKDGAWKKDAKPTYDTTITDGSKDKTMTFEYIKEYFKKS